MCKETQAGPASTPSRAARDPRRQHRGSHASASELVRSAPMQELCPRRSFAHIPRERTVPKVAKNWHSISSSPYRLPAVTELKTCAFSTGKVSKLLSRKDSPFGEPMLHWLHSTSHCFRWSKLKRQLIQQFTSLSLHKRSNMQNAKLPFEVSP